MYMLNTRQEMAKKINVERVTTIRVDLADADEWGLKGPKVLVNTGRELLRCDLRAYADSMEFKVYSNGCCLSSSFGYSDLEEMVAYANAPVIKPDSDVVIVVVDSKKKVAYAPLVLHTSKRVNPGCLVPIGFEDGKESALPFLLQVSDYMNEYFEARQRYLGR